MPRSFDPRRAKLTLPHIKPLSALIANMRQKGLIVPNVDPNDGGVNARLLILLESPGPKAVGSNFISQDNPDNSARNMKKALSRAGLQRRDVVLWNVVPQCISNAERNKNASCRDIKNAIPNTNAFIRRLPKLKVIIFGGRRAQVAIKFLAIPKHVKIIQTFHTGAQSYNRAEKRADIHSKFKSARRLIGRPIKRGARI